MRKNIQSYDLAVKRPALWTYAWWGVTGALLSLGLASLLTIGIFLLCAAAILVVVGMAIEPLRRGGHLGALAGLSLAPLYLAWVNRQGPGTVCTAVRDGTRCEELYSPWPFVAVGVLVLSIAVALVRASARR